MLDGLDPRDRRVIRRRPEGHRAPPVHHLHFAEGPDHDVRWLQVAVQEPAFMGKGHRIADLQQDLQMILQRAGLKGRWRRARHGFQQRRPGDAFNALHHQLQPLVRIRNQVMDGHHVRVLQRGRDHRLGIKAPTGIAIARAKQTLHRHPTAEDLLGGQVDGTKAAPSQLRSDGESGGLVLLLGHAPGGGQRRGDDGLSRRVVRGDGLIPGAMDAGISVWQPSRWRGGLLGSIGLRIHRDGVESATAPRGSSGTTRDTPGFDAVMTRELPVGIPHLLPERKQRCSHPLLTDRFRSSVQAFEFNS